MVPSVSLRAAVVISTALVTPLAAQDAPGGRLLTFGTTFGLQASDNVDLDANDANSLAATTNLTFGLSSATPAERLEIGSNLGLRLLAGGEESAETFSLSNPNLTASYRRQSRSAALSLQGRVSRSEVSRIGPQSLIPDPTTGVVDLEETANLDALITDTPIPRDARRLTFSTSADLETGRDAPFGVTYSLGLSGVRYNDATPDIFEDTTRLTGSLGLRFSLSPITQATTDIRTSIYDSDERDDGVTVILGLVQARPTGSVGTSVGFVNRDRGTRVSLSFAGSVERPTATLSGSAGVGRDEDGELAFIGTADLTYALSRTQNLSLTASRRLIQLDRLTELDDDSSRTVTSLEFGYDRDLTALWNFDANARYVRTETLSGIEQTDDFGQFGVGLARRLTPDWALNLRADHRFETGSDGFDADGNTVSVSVSRTFRTPY